MKLTEENVLKVQHKMIQDSLLWETFDSDRLMQQMLAYVTGINDMTQAIIEAIREVKNCGAGS